MNVKKIQYTSPSNISSLLLAALIRCCPDFAKFVLNIQIHKVSLSLLRKNNCFSHGQLYVTVFRIKKLNNLYIYAPKNKTFNVILHIILYIKKMLSVKKSPKTSQLIVWPFFNNIVCIRYVFLKLNLYKYLFFN